MAALKAYKEITEQYSQEEIENRLEEDYFRLSNHVLSAMLIQVTAETALSY
jgi:hypothetical protein